MDRRGGSKKLRTIHELIFGPHLLALLPALTLAAFWTGGEAMMLLMALGLPVLYAALGGMPDLRRDLTETGQQQNDLTDGDALRSLAATVLNRARRNRCTTACVLVELEGLSDIDPKPPERMLSEVRFRMLNRLRSTVRSSDRVTRIGDQRFAIFLTPDRRMDLEGMLHLARRLLNMAEEPLYYGRTPIFLSASVGICLSSRLPDSARNTAMLDRAEEALDEALAHGPSAIRAFTGVPLRSTPPSSALREDLSQALEKGEIAAWYQPQICCDTGRVSGVEALARWLHPERGIVPPGEFLAALEEAKLTERLAEVMLRQSLTALKSWDAAGLGVPRVSINLSGDELRNPKLSDRIRWELDRQDVPPERLGVEILESVIGGGIDEVVERNIRALGACGCEVDLDDFGTGDASLQALRRFDITRIKIDRSFVAHVDRDERQRRVVAGILAMADTLGLETVAEGVEGSAEHTLLAQLGCGHVQGFGIARPMPEPQFRKWVIEHRGTLTHSEQLRHRG